MPRLIVHGPGGATRRVELVRDVFCIGRSPDNDLPLEAEGVGDHHARLTRSENGYVLSGRGGESLVNGGEPNESPLRSGDTIRLGTVRLTFEGDDGASPASPWDQQRVSIEDLAIEQSQLTRDEPVRNAARLGLLYSAGKEVLSAASLEDVIQLVLPLVFESIAAERGALLLRDSATGGMHPRLLSHRDGRRLAEGEFPIPRSIVAEVVNDRLGIVTLDALHDSRFEDKASVKREHIRSALCAPLWDGEQVLGVIYLDSRIESGIFGRSDLTLLSALANLIAIRLKQDALYGELAEERVVRTTLQRYHSPDVVEEILSRATSSGEPEIGLEEREVSILFADLKGWTPFAESVPPAVVAALLNEYYALGARVVFAHGGSIHEYLGDSVMAIFGAPVAHEDHADRAVSTGLELLEAMASQRDGLIAEFGSQVRVAINSGRAIVGHIGSPTRLKYAVVGDPVNVAARLEHIGEPNTVTIGEGTWSRLSDREGWKALGALKLRGRDKRVRAYQKRGP